MIWGLIILSWLLYHGGKIQILEDRIEEMEKNLKDRSKTWE